MIPLIIGKNSNGQDKTINLAAIPLLMISCSNDHQLQDILTKLTSLHYPYKEPDFIITSSKFIQVNANSCGGHVFLKDKPGNPGFKSRAECIDVVIKQMKQRQKILNQARVDDFKQYVALNLRNPTKLTYRFLVIDDIWDVVTAKPKSIALSFMHILLNGPAAGIHTIFASGISYRNLLQQLIQIHPAIVTELQRKFGKPEPTKLNVLGAELIFTPEELVFLTENVAVGSERFFRSVL